MKVGTMKLKLWDPKLRLSVMTARLVGIWVSNSHKFSSNKTGSNNRYSINMQVFTTPKTA